MYVATKGGEAAIENSHAMLAEERRGDPAVPELAVDQLREQLGRAVDRVMTEGSLYDPDLAALAIKQAQGDMIEAIFLLRAFRTTLPRFGAAEPIDTSRMTLRRRISAAFKDLPGGQVLGPTYDYTHRLLDLTLAARGETPPTAPEAEPTDAHAPRVADLLEKRKRHVAAIARVLRDKETLDGAAVRRLLKTPVKRRTPPAPDSSAPNPTAQGSSAPGPSAQSPSTEDSTAQGSPTKGETA